MALDVTSDTFEAEVLATSETQPVLVDFWAEWCGPCRMLGPVLDRVEAEYGGRFKLVKLNTDHNQAIAARYRISGIPAVKLFINGEIQAEFTGALPDHAVRRFLDQNLPDPELKKLASLPPFEAGRGALQLDSNHPERFSILWRATLAGLNAGEEVAAIKAMLEVVKLKADRGLAEKAEGVLEFMERHPTGSAGAATLSQALAGQTSSLDFFLSKLRANSKDTEAKADFLILLKIFPDTDTVNDYRRQLSRLLF
ncbi:MAG: thioredoxin [Spirochaetales bacterium]|nr:thioredoxin [Spirochaetales bacterium]